MPAKRITFQNKVQVLGYDPAKLNASEINALKDTANDHADLLDQLTAVTGHTVNELSLPQPVVLGSWYLQPNGIWEALRSFNAVAAPIAGANWKRIVQFSSYTDAQAVAAAVASGQLVLSTDNRLAALPFEAIKPGGIRSRHATLSDAFEVVANVGGVVVASRDINEAFTLPPYVSLYMPGYNIDIAGATNAAISVNYGRNTVVCRRISIAANNNNTVANNFGAELHIYADSVELYSGSIAFYTGAPQAHTHVHARVNANPGTAGRIGFSDGGGNLTFYEDIVADSALLGAVFYHYNAGGSITAHKAVTVKQAGAIHASGSPNAFITGSVTLRGPVKSNDAGLSKGNNTNYYLYSLLDMSGSTRSDFLAAGIAIRANHGGGVIEFGPGAAIRTAVGIPAISTENGTAATVGYHGSLPRTVEVASSITLVNRTPVGIAAGSSTPGTVDSYTKAESDARYALKGDSTGGTTPSTGGIDFANPTTLNAAAALSGNMAYYVKGAGYTLALPDAAANLGKAIFISIASNATGLYPIQGISGLTMYAGETVNLRATLDGWKETGGKPLAMVGKIETSLNQQDVATNNDIYYIPLSQVKKSVAALPGFVDASQNGIVVQRAGRATVNALISLKNVLASSGTVFLGIGLIKPGQSLTAPVQIISLPSGAGGISESMSLTDSFGPGDVIKIYTYLENASAQLRGQYEGSQCSLSYAEIV
jgi:hypothetical protein